jgi:hypothetical protein
MKKLLTVTLLFYALTSSPQTTLFKDNLFRSSQKSVEVIDKSDYILLIFDGSDSVKIYKWEYEPLIDAFKSHYINLNENKDDDITMEAFRVFYDVQKYLILNKGKQNRLVAGSMGFENSHIFLKKVKRNSIYSDNLNEAIEHFKLAGKEVSFKQFIVKSKDQIIDKLIDKSNPYPIKYLKKYGPSNFEEYFDKQITETYLYFLDSIEDALTSYNILSDKISISEKDTAILNKEISVLEKKTFIQNSLGVELKDKIKGLEKETETDKLKELGRKFRDSLNTASPFPQIPDSLFNGRFVPVIKFKQLSLYRDLEKVSINMLLDKVGKNTQNRKKADSLQQSLIQTNITQKKLLLSKLKNYNKELSNNRENIYETIQKIKKIKESALTEYGYEILNMKIDSIEVEINQTFIEKFVVFGKIEYYGFQKNKRIDVNQTYVTLRNKVPIGISSLNSIDNNNKDLKRPFLKNYYTNVKLFATINGMDYEVDLYKVLAYYRPKLKEGRRDLSPADTSFTVRKIEGVLNVTLLKPPSEKLFEFKVFSDFMGMNGTNPNGLVQTEFSKEMYLNPYRHLFCQDQNWSAYWGLGAYISPNILISKFEKTRKYLSLTKINDTSYVSTLSLKQYEIYSVGTDLNLLTLSVPSANSIFYLDLGLADSGVGVADSTRNVKDSVIVIEDHSLNALTWRLLVRCNMQTDERYFFEMRGGLQYIKLLTDDVTQLASLEKKNLEESWRNKTLYSVELFAGYSPTSNTKGRLFLRYRYFGSFAKKVYDGYSQIQLGYSYYFDK